MTDKEYQYNVDLLLFLRNVVKESPAFSNGACIYLESCIDELEKELDDIFDKQTEETK